MADRPAEVGLELRVSSYAGVTGDDRWSHLGRPISSTWGEEKIATILVGQSEEDFPSGKMREYLEFHRDEVLLATRTQLA